MEPRRTLALRAATCWAAGGLVALAVMSGWTARFDAAGLLIWRDAATHAPAGPGWLIPIWRALTHLGDGTTRKAAGMLIAALLIARGQARAAAPLALVVLTDGLINEALKAAFARPRPQIAPHLVDAAGFSFPSGHAFGAAATYFTIALTLSASPTSTNANHRSLMGAAIMLSGVVAFSRVWLGVHYPSDVIGGWLGGAGLAFAATALLRPRARTAPGC